jgi:hypothetical protein
VFIAWDRNVKCKMEEWSMKGKKKLFIAVGLLSSMGHDILYLDMHKSKKDVRDFKEASERKSFTSQRKSVKVKSPMHPLSSSPLVIS